MSTSPQEPATPGGGTATAERPASAVQATVPWTTIVWDDPVNLMSYVTHVFVTYFRFPRLKAEQLMLRVHHEGRAAVATGTREEMEQHVTALHAYGLWATLERAQ